MRCEQCNSIGVCVGGRSARCFDSCSTLRTNMQGWNLIVLKVGVTHMFECRKNMAKWTDWYGAAPQLGQGSPI